MVEVMKKKLKLLIAEDEVIIAQWIRMELQDEGYEVCKCVTTGEEAVITAEEQHPDIAVIDIHLAGEIDGIDAADKIINSFKIPVIFITGFSEQNLFERASKLKPAAYITKPVEINELLSEIKNVTNTL
jgi:CheY-like chemotaxis protein